MNILTLLSAGTRVLVVLSATPCPAQSNYQPYIFTTLAGGGGFNSPDMPGSAARFLGPLTVAVDSAGNVYVAETLNHTIRKITPAGSNWSVTTLAGSPDPAGYGGCADGTGSSARFSFPGGLAVDGAGNLYVADSGNQTIRKVTPAGLVTTRAGPCGQNGSTDGIGTTARFNSPNGIWPSFLIVLGDDQ